MNEEFESKQQPAGFKGLHFTRMQWTGVPDGPTPLR